MTTWIETSNIHQDGTPVTRRIKLESYDSEVWFTDNAYAEVADDVADILASTVSHITKLSSAPADPGTYYGDASNHETININVADGTFDNLVAQSIDIDSWTGDSINVSELSIGSISDWDWINVVQQGADPTGTDDSAPTIESLLDTNTLLIFPDGEYYIGREISATGIENVGMVSAGDVTIRPDSAMTQAAIQLGGTTTDPDSDRVDNAYVSGIDFDVTGTGVGVMPVHIRATSRFVCEDVTVTGTIEGVDTPAYNGGRFALLDSDGVGLVRRYRLPDGGEDVSGLHGMTVPSDESVGGTIRFEDCQVEGFYDNGLYCSSTGTHIVVDGGRFGNNAISNVRFMSDRPSVLRGAFIHVDDTTLTNPNGVWFRSGGSHRVTDTKFEYADGVDAGPLNCGADMTADPVVRGVIAEIGTSSFCSVGSGSPTVTIRDSVVTGSGNTTQAAIPVTAGKVNLYNVDFLFSDVSTDGTRTAVRFDTDGCVARDCTIETTREALWIRGNDCQVSGCTLTSFTDNDFEDEGTDNHISNTELVNNTFAIGTATRPRWGGVIGGGLFGGVDLSTVAGTEDGEEAMSDGTATGFPEFSRAAWDSTNSQWVRLDGQATVAPA